MKKLFLILSLVIAASWLWSCDNDDEDLSVKHLRIYTFVSPPDSAENVVVFTATAINATSYSWDFGMDSTATGMQVTAYYPRTDTFYVITCTAKGAVDKISVTDTVRWN
ncbi:MAG: hypothetical protein GXO47_00765 [Chlorobi bacterium]|nr:hypothetical protein [Chlorobiota bacterium]